MSRLVLLFTVFAVFSLPSAYGIRNVTKAVNAKVYSHIMPWFETPASSGSWGIHWTMANQNPDIVDGSGRRQIASIYYPEIGPYASGDADTIEYQLLLMKYAGIDGLLIDWPGTTKAWDYETNMANCEAIIRGAERVGLDFAIVYEDHNIGMAADAGLITDRIGQAKADMAYMRDNYFGKSNYVQINGHPLLLDFGPQTFYSPNEWAQIFEPLSNKPTFLTLWGQNYQAGDLCAGEYPWLYVDFDLGLRNFYNYRPLDVKFGVAYPGFETFYQQGGWPGPSWTIPVSPATFTLTMDLAIEANVQWIQLATWNDYGEGTVVEPTREHGNAFLNILQQKQGLIYGDKELEIVKSLYAKRKEHKENKAKQAILDVAAQLLIDLKPEAAAQVIASV